MTTEIRETLRDKKVRAGHLGGRPRSLTFDEMVLRGLVKPLEADYKNRNEGGPQLNTFGGKSTFNISNNLRSLKRLARQQMRRG